MKVLFKFTVFILFFYSCIDPLDVEVNESERRLIVVAEISDQEREYKVDLQRTANYDELFNEKEVGAKVSVIDDEGNENFFNEKRDGQYWSCPSEFVAESGRTYKLKIETSNGSIYESTWEKMEPVGVVDSVYYKASKREREVNGRRFTEEGVRVYCNFKDTEQRDYFKIDWQGTYMFRAAPMDRQHSFCWNTEYSTLDIKIHNDEFSNNSLIEDFEVTFLPDGLRFTQDYSFQVELKSMSKGAYNFWLLIQKQFESDGSIFSALPAQIKGNLRSVSNPSEKVLGYFVVSAIDTKRIRIPSYVLTGINEAALSCKQFNVTDPLEAYCYDCTKYRGSSSEKPAFW